MWLQLTQNMNKCEKYDFNLHKICLQLTPNVKMWLQLRVEWGKCGKCDFNLHKILINVKNVTSTYTKYE